MENRNIYKTDDFLIISSYIMIIPIGLLAWPWLKTFGEFDRLLPWLTSASGTLGTRLSALGLYFCGALASQIAGRIIRHGEKESLEILDTLQFYRNTTVSQLASQLDMPPARVSKLVKKMARISSLGIEISGESLSLDKMAGQNAPPKEYGAPASGTSEESTGEKEAAENSTEQLYPGERKKFNFILFIFLFLTPLWPLALVYAITYGVKQQKKTLTDHSDKTD